MASFREGKVAELLEERSDLVRARVEVDGDLVEAVGFPSMLGPLSAGDRVVVNMTGVDLGLGTGGVAFLLWNLDASSPHPTPGHIMKLRYTPWQMNVLAAEAPESKHHDALADVTSIDGMPVVAAGLHSQVSAIAAGIKAGRPDARVGYLMTDGGALPIAWSRTVRAAREASLIDVTCTAGHAFGGDLESVNVFSGLAALRVAGDCTHVVAAMGPGVVGTDTALGFSAIEQGQVLDAVNAVSGRAIAALRITFAEKRDRHRGISHHTLTALDLAARDRATIVAPKLSPESTARLEDQLRASGVCEKHDLVWVDGRPGFDLIHEKGIELRSMGRTMSDVPELFLAASAAGRVAGENG